MTTECCYVCGRTTRRGPWPEGRLCTPCSRSRLRRFATCPRCGQRRSLPGIGPDGAWICGTCAGIDSADLCCRSCGATDDFEGPARCRRCTLDGRVRRLFDNGTGTIDQAFVPLVDALAGYDPPRNGLSWLSKPDVADRIRAVATGAVSLTHDGIDELPAGIGREHLRELLITHGALPARNRFLAAYQRWATDRLAAITPPADRHTIAAYLRWHHHPRLERLAETGELTESRYASTRNQTNISIRFLAWLRDRGTDLGSSTQADIDAWFADGPTTRILSRPFLRWAIRTNRCPPHHVPNTRPVTPRGIPETDRLHLLSTLLIDDTIDLIDRVAGSLVLLYALPATRVHRLRLTDLHPDGDGLAINIGGDQPLPVPEPLAELLDQLAADRHHLNGAGHPSSDWLFPGRVAGHPIEADHLAERLNAIGITRAARTAALNALLADIPAPVLAHALGRNPSPVTERAKTLGTDWARYASLKANQ